MKHIRFPKCSQVFRRSYVKTARDLAEVSKITVLVSNCYSFLLFRVKAFACPILWVYILSFGLFLTENITASVDIFYLCSFYILFDLYFHCGETFSSPRMFSYLEIYLQVPIGMFKLLHLICLRVTN